MLTPISLTIRTSSKPCPVALQALQLHRAAMPQRCVGLTTSPTARDINDITLPRGYRGGCREAPYHPRQYRARACAYPSEAPGTSSREATKPITTLPSPGGCDERAVNHRQILRRFDLSRDAIVRELPQRAKLQCSEPR